MAEYFDSEINNKLFAQTPPHPACSLSVDTGLVKWNKVLLHIQENAQFMIQTKPIHIMVIYKLIAETTARSFSHAIG